MKPSIIAVNGLAGSGKSTSANHFIEQHGYSRSKMADTLKRMTRVLFEDAGVPEEDIERLIEGSQADKLEPIEQLKGVCSRHIMKTLGSEWRDLIYSTLWVDIAIAKMHRRLANGEVLVIDDLRFKHEHERLWEEFGGDILFLKVEGPNHDAVVHADTHQSERPMDDKLFHAILQNQGTLPQLYDALNGALDAFEGLGNDDLSPLGATFENTPLRIDTRHLIGGGWEPQHLVH